MAVRSPLLQNDNQLTEYPEIASAGCLWRSLLHLVELEAEETFSDLQLLALYEEAVGAGLMTSGCFVKDHAGIIQSGLDYWGMDGTARYLRRDSMDEDVTSNWDSGQQHEPTHYLRHFETFSSQGGTIGHFVVAWEDGTSRWDPYFPSGEVLSERSFRVYSIL